MRTTDWIERHERSEDVRGVATQNGGVTFLYAQVERDIGGTVSVLGVLPDNVKAFGEKAGRVVSRWTMLAEDFDDGAMAAMDMHVAMKYGHQLAIRLVPLFLIWAAACGSL
jgi:hypothetical protein